MGGMAAIGAKATGQLLAQSGHRFGHFFQEARKNTHSNLLIDGLLVAFLHRKRKI
jgi:hypothetical protein